LREVLGFKSLPDVAEACREWVGTSLKQEDLFRDRKWTESVAVGSESFVKGIKDELGFRAKGRRIVGGDDGFILKESQSPYNSGFGEENAALRPQNVYYWKNI
jgi:putative transposase